MTAAGISRRTLMADKSLHEEILRALKNDGPSSGRGVAERLGRRLSTVVEALRSLEKQQRGTHSGTRWAFARFEVPAQTWRFTWTREQARSSVRTFSHEIRSL